MSAAGSCLSVRCSSRDSSSSSTRVSDVTLLTAQGAAELNHCYTTWFHVMYLLHMTLLFPVLVVLGYKMTFSI